MRLYIFLFYVVTVTLFLSLGYYFLEIAQVHNLWVFAVVVLMVVVLSGVLISKLAIDPLVEYVHHLQNLSKETLHELNLPISTINTNIQMLKKNTQDEKTHKRLERIEAACEMLQQRYGELDYLIKKQTKQEIRERFFVDELVLERVAFLSQLYPHMEFHTSLERFEYTTDRVGLGKVIDNVIDNGVKYSKNSKDIEITLHEGVLSIRDFGIGIDEVQLVHIFDNFYQTNSDMQGFGIGLAMVKRFCDTHAIALSVKSQPDKGTTVSLQF